jgi:hypothetical protein
MEFVIDAANSIMTTMETIKEIRITRNNFKKSMLAAALLAAGVLFASTPAQATIVDLIHGDSGSINGAIYEYTAPQPTGTGLIQPFLRVQADGVEQATTLPARRFPSMIRLVLGRTT